MIEKISYIESTVTCPYQNLAMEEYLLLHCAKGECILYLWQNRNTVVIGKNQNAWKECKVDKLEEEGGNLARRLSGGGAVYHDLGNLNFTFIAQKDNYDIEKQTKVILKAVQKLGLHAEQTGRNDIILDGRKFSGHAYYEHGIYCYHHGTIMVKVNKEDLSKYLTVSKEKLKSKGVDSVRSRVCNLTEYLPNLSIEQLKKVLLESFEEIYEKKAFHIGIDEFDKIEFEKGVERFSSWEWRLGKKIDFQYELSNRFSWGIVTLQLTVKNGKIDEVVFFSDAINTNVIETLPEYLKDIRYDKQEIREAIARYQPADDVEKNMIKDIDDWFGWVEL